MSRLIVDLLLILIGFIIVIVWLAYQIKDFSTLEKSVFFKWKRFKYPTLLFLIIGLPIYLLNYTPLYSLFKINSEDVTESTYNIYCWIIALSISMVWLRYILKLDIYEKEKWKHIAAIFIMSFITTYGCDYLYPLFRSFGFNLNGEIVNDFIYCVFGIGFIEETVKFIPFLILLKFTKAINEPYDYLLYASIAALGFAFAENVRYLNNYGIHIATGRAIYAAVAHMTFCSTVAYGLLLKKYRFKKYPTILVFMFFFFIAMFVHGFYDFWLINELVTDYQGVTTVFFIVTIHLWFTMKNNAINISPFYDEKKRINNDKIKQYLVISLTSIFMFSYVYVALFFDVNEATDFFWKTAVSYGYVIFYLIMSLSRYNIIKGIFKPLTIPFHFIVPVLKKKNLKP